MILFFYHVIWHYSNNVCGRTSDNLSEQVFQLYVDIKPSKYVLNRFIIKKNHSNLYWCSSIVRNVFLSQLLSRESKSFVLCFACTFLHMYVSRTSGGWSLLSPLFFSSFVKRLYIDGPSRISRREQRSYRILTIYRIVIQIWYDIMMIWYDGMYGYIG